MKILMKPRLRNTGNVWEISDKTLSANQIRLTEEGVVSLSVTLDPIHTTGSFNGEIRFTIAEIYTILGKLEEQKLALIAAKQPKAAKP